MKTPPGKQQNIKLTFGLARRPELVFLLSLLMRTEERKKVSVTFFNYLSEYYLLLLQHTPSW